MPKAPSLARTLDKFYTRPEVAADCVQAALRAIGPLNGSVLYLDPSAGGGAFLDRLPQPRIGLDILPSADRPDILRADFLRWRPREAADHVVIITNVPFGKNASLARRFLNHAATFAAFVASILPRTFEKAGVRARLDPRLHLRHEWPLDAASFLLDGAPASVPVVFQVYEVAAGARRAESPVLTHADFDFVRDPGAAHFAFQRVGARAGLVSDEGLGKSPQSHYFIRVRSADVDVRSVLSGIAWDDVKHRTAGNPSIGKAELVAAYAGATR